MAVLNIIAANNWERPIYFDHSLLHLNSLFFKEYLQFEGLAYRLIPIKTERAKSGEYGRINTDILYNNVMNKFVWGNVNDPNIFLDEYNKRSISIMQVRYMFARLAEALSNEGKNDNAVEVLDRLFEILPNEIIPLTFDSFPAAEQYFIAGANEKGTALSRILANNSFAMLEYYLSLPINMASMIKNEQNREVVMLQNIRYLAYTYNQNELFNEVDSRLKSLVEM